MAVVVVKRRTMAVCLGGFNAIPSTDCTGCRHVLVALWKRNTNLGSVVPIGGLGLWFQCRNTQNVVVFNQQIHQEGVIIVETDRPQNYYKYSMNRCSQVIRRVKFNGASAMKGTRHVLHP